MQMTHAATGVEKGLAAANGMPIEVMGLLHGHIDTENDRTLVVTDVSDANLSHVLKATRRPTVHVICRPFLYLWKARRLPW